MVHKKVPIIIQRKEERIVSILKITRLSFFFFINLGRQTGSEISEKLEKEEALLFCSFPSWPVCHLGWSAGWLPIWMVKKQTQYKSSLNIWYVMRQNNCSDTETRESRKGRERAVLLFCCFSILLFCHWFCCLVYLGWSAGWLPSNKKKRKFESETNKIEIEEIKTVLQI